MKKNWILKRLEEYKNLPALINEDTIYSYKDILDCYTRLNDFDIKTGSVVYIRGGYSPLSIAALFWALSKKLIIIPVSLQSWSSTPNYFKIIAPNYIIDCENTNHNSGLISVSSEPYSHDIINPIFGRQHSALILFSSGTTGHPKAAVHDFNQLVKRYEPIKKNFKTIIFLNIDHIGGLNTLFSVLSPGGTIIVPKTTHPGDVCKVIAKYCIELLPTTPSFLRMLLMSQAVQHYDLSSLKIISYGTEIMPEVTLKKLKHQLPHVRFKQTYGSTELGILATLSKSDDSTWFQIDKKKTPYKIIDGILWVKLTRSSLKGYLNAQFEIEDNWVNTKDRVLLNEDFIKISGRESEMINVGGNKVDPHEIEAFLLHHEGVKDVLIYGKSSPVLGQIVIAKIAHQLDADVDELRARLLKSSKEHLESFKVPALFIMEPEITYSTRWKKMRMERLVYHFFIFEFN